MHNNAAVNARRAHFRVLSVMALAPCEFFQLSEPFGFSPAKLRSHHVGYRLSGFKSRLPVRDSEPNSPGKNILDRSRRLCPDSVNNLSENVRML